MDRMFFWVKFGNAFADFVVSFLLARIKGTIIQYYLIQTVYFDCKIKLCLKSPGRQE